MLINNTPLESYQLNGREILVKREDLCCPNPGPSFSKMRGVVAHMQNRPEKTIGVLDTFHSKAGWAVSYAGENLGKNVVDYWPRYKADGPEGIPRKQQRIAASMGAQLVDFQAGRSAVLFHQARKHLRENYEDSYMMPNALKLPESITENAAEALRTAPELPHKGTIVISVSSGTVASGVLLGLHQAGALERYQIILHMGYSRSRKSCIDYMEKCSGVSLKGRVWIVDEKYGYKDAAKGVECPFPCNPYYDLKAWKWLGRPENAILIGNDPVVFWNIGD